MSAQSISLKTSDGHSVTAYEARPAKSPRGGIVLLQEIFGITGYIRRVCESYAGQGYHVVAPALFDRIRPGIELNYSKEDAVTGRDLRSKIPWEKTFADLIDPHGFRQNSVGRTEALPDLERADQCGAGLGLGRQAGVRFKYDERNLVVGQRKRGGETDRSGADDGNRIL